MAIASMTRLQLIGMSYEREKLLNALADTGAVHIKSGEREQENTEDNSVVNLSEKIVHLNKIIEYISDTSRKNGIDLPKESVIDISFKDFISIENHADYLEGICKEADNLSEKLIQNNQEKSKLLLNANSVRQYIKVDVPFSNIKNTKKVNLILGTLSGDGYNKLDAFINDECPLSLTMQCGVGENGTVVFVACHVLESEKIAAKLGELSFTRCPFDYDLTAAQKIKQLQAAAAEIEKEDNLLIKKICGYSSEINKLKVYADRLQFEKQKQEYATNFEKTAATFTLEAFVPVVAKTAVNEKLSKISNALYFTFEEITEQDEPPTLMENNKLVKQFEFVTNMYSPPVYKEFDPNTIVAFFFSLFFGFIMADIGYGLLLTLCLLFAGKIKQDNGTRRLLYIIGIGGIFAFIFGILFGGFFGLSRANGINWLPKAIIPDPVTNSQEVLLYCLMFGAVHLMFGFISKGLTLIKQKQVWDAVWDGFVWALFLVGMLLLFPMFSQSVFNTKLFGGFEPPALLNNIGISICGAVIAVEIFASGRHSKGLGKAVKGFTSIYGLINIFADLLSYARLYGLMLSGAMIANIVSTMSLQLASTGIVGTIGAVIILVIGHAFNIGMGVLGAYIHDARLQFIEYFGKFYEGEGELFSPIGSNLNYTQLVAAKNDAVKDIA